MVDNAVGWFHSIALGKVKELELFVGKAQASQVVLGVKNPPTDAGDIRWVRFFGWGNGNPLQYSCWKNPRTRSLEASSPKGGGGRRAWTWAENEAAAEPAGRGRARPPWRDRLEPHGVPFSSHGRPRSGEGENWNDREGLQRPRGRDN